MDVTSAAVIPVSSSLESRVDIGNDESSETITGQRGCLKRNFEKYHVLHKSKMHPLLVNNG